VQIRQDNAEIAKTEEKIKQLEEEVREYEEKIAEADKSLSELKGLNNPSRFKLLFLMAKKRYELENDPESEDFKVWFYSIKNVQILNFWLI